jgi:hypothetical protein
MTEARRDGRNYGTMGVLNFIGFVWHVTPVSLVIV